MRLRALALPVLLAAAALATAATVPTRARNGMVASQNFVASQVGIEALWDGGNAVDAAVATAFALAVTHPSAGNIGGGGFLLYRPPSGPAVAYDFRGTAPPGASPTRVLTDGLYAERRSPHRHPSLSVPGTRARLHTGPSAH